VSIERRSTVSEGTSIPARVGVALAPPGFPAERLYTPQVTSSLVRDALVQAGLGKVDPQAPLADIVRPGATVLLKPNWVLHHNQGGHGMECMVTHPMVIAAVVAELKAAGAGRIILGDAPIQACHFDELVTEDLKAALRGLAAPVPLEFVDFRRTRIRSHNLAANVVTDARGEDRYVLFDLGADSLLEEITEDGEDQRFRVTSYDPKKLAATHRRGRHQYLLAREAFEADVVISLPKLKTHRKAGLTAALKNLVGMNGNKDYLPHHRLGGAKEGGDCYDGAAPWKLAAELYLDAANTHINTPAYDAWARRAFGLLELFARRGENADVEGAWHGNDTIWRTVLDLNRLLLYGGADGTLSDTPRRTLWSLTDALIAGQGEGPLAAEPLRLGAVTFSGCAPFADAVHAVLLGLDPRRIPNVAGALGAFRYPLAPADEPVGAWVEGAFLDLSELRARVAVDARPPRGWAGHCELPPLDGSADPAAALPAQP
jgi:uncharacterized protein (DUF362 family)